MSATRFAAPALTAAWVLGLALAARRVGQDVPEPYMDEIFHAPQAAAYCRGEWTRWDPKLTTPPGLYLLSVLAAKAQQALGHGDGHCSSLSVLRAMSLVSLLVLPWLLAALRSALIGTRRHARQARTAAALQAFSLASLPPLWMLGFLYYTDVPSLLAVLLCYLLAVKRCHVLSSLAGIASLLFRQTNIIWIAFVAWTVVLADLEDGGAHLPPLARQSPGLLRPLKELSQSLTRQSWATWRSIATHLVIYLPSPLLFVAFLLWNGGIVLGDKSNHQAGLHAMQLPYLALFTSFFGWPTLLSLGGGVFGLARSAAQLLSSRSRLLGFAALLAAITAMVRWGTVFHPFLLADNRHYAFYFRRRLLALPATRYALVPLYALSVALWGRALAQTRSLPWILGWAGSSALVLVPSPLLEPRYFVVPYMILRLNLPPPEDKHRSRADPGQPDPQTNDTRPARAWSLLCQPAAVELVWATAINAVTMYIFLFRPFAWPQEPGRAQRFMW